MSAPHASRVVGSSGHGGASGGGALDADARDVAVSGGGGKLSGAGALSRQAATAHARTIAAGRFTAFTARKR